MLEAVNVARQCCHHLGEGSLRPNVVPGHMHRALCDVTEITGCDNHMDFLVQELYHFFPGYFVLDHGKQDLKSNGVLLIVRQA